MQPLVSVIVPVYKVENYLPRCIESLYKQSLKEIEIILIDDASPDSSGKICEQYAKKDPRCKVIHHTENKGLAAARNTGIQHATANYLMFVDSDDWVNENFCKKAYECAINYQAEIVIFPFQSLSESRFFGMRNKKRTMFDNGYKTPKDAIKLMLNGIGGFAWNKLFQKQIFEKTTFPEGYLYEDLRTIYKIVAEADTIYYLDEVLYYYYQRPGRISTLRTKKACNDWAKMNLLRIQDLSSWGVLTTEELDIIIKNMALNYIMWRKEDLSDPYSILFAKILQKTNSVPTYFTWKRKILFVLFKHCPVLFDFICNICGKRSFTNENT